MFTHKYNSELNNKLLEIKMNNILERLETNIDHSNRLLEGINNELEKIVLENSKLIELCEIYNIWINKL
ncbi:hypothetical protein EBI_21821 [Enterocytozoon bieneusi H348]|nr:hypothetical protein EBI_21821 [Enterocytozoon bieneusi H348]|eukprot:XP_002650371.1 hypothetical protein EBI_21821 [Enterocytozoon bieneusi H348]